MRNDDHTPDTWDTLEEVGFIRLLGQHCAAKNVVEGTGQRGEPLTVSRAIREPGYTAEVLAGYIEGAERRTDWGAIDGQTALAYARHRLAEMRGRGDMDAGKGPAVSPGGTSQEPL